MKFWHFLDILKFSKILSLKSFDKSVALYSKSGRILRDRLWTFLVDLNTIEQRSKNVMISKHWNNQYCYNRLILENYVKITKTKIMRWEADKRLYKWCNNYTNIKYQVVIDEKSGVIEIKTKMLQ